MPEQKLSKLEITDFCERHWHSAPDEISYPGGEGRKTVWSKSVDDLVWLLADEWTPICQEAEQELLSLAARSKNLSMDELSHRFRIKAVLHSLVRLLLIFERKGDGPWRSVQSSMEYDRVGASLPHVNRVCRRAMGWIEETPELHDLAPLFRAIGDHAARLPV